MESVSAVIPAHNAEPWLGDAIDSVLAQSHPPVRCVVVDDGSTDGTAALAAAYGDRVTLVRQANGGVASARNRGATAAGGELLAFLDADDRWLPERLERQLAVLAARPALEAVVCATRVVDRDLAPLGVWTQEEAVTAEDLLLCRARVVSVSSNLVITRRAFEEIGGFDERLSTSADWSMMLRLLDRGRLATMPEPLVEYRVHDANMSSDVERFERDMLAAFDGVFADPRVLSASPRLRRRAYANLSRTIAGSYFVRRELRPFARHAARSIATHPSTLGYFLALPARRLRRGRDPFTNLRGRGRPPA